MTDQEGLAILHRLRWLHAQALELYILRRLKCEDAEVQKKRLLWLNSKILIYQYFDKAVRRIDADQDNGGGTIPSRAMKKRAIMNAKRIKRLLRLHAIALGMYMARSASGDSAKVQKRRLDKLTSALLAEMEIKNE